MRTNSPFALFAAVATFTALLHAVPVQARPVTVTITQVTDVDLEIDGDVFPSPGDFYAGVTIDGTRLDTWANAFSFPYDVGTGYEVPFGPLIPNPAWALTRDVADDATVVPLRIELWDHDDCGSPFCSDCGFLCNADDRADINPDSAKEVIELDVDLTTGRWTGDVNWPRSCVGSSQAALCFDISVLSSTGDADGDALPDGWEQNGFNADGDDTIDLDLPALGAHPLRKDVFVEVDCLVAATHGHCPRLDAIIDVVRSFANAPVLNLDGTLGIQLHLDIGPVFGPGAIFPVVGGVSGTYGDLGGGGSQIDEAGNEVIDWDGAAGSPATRFYALKQPYFDARRAPVFRYALFAHQTNYRRALDDCTSGWAEGLSANDFFVTLGGVDELGFPCWSRDLNNFSVGSRTEQAGTFMHELGHALGLHHGGDEEQNDKPNYLSVMSYAFQQCDVPPSPNGVLPGDCDYSRIALPPLAPASLDETNLDECTGIDAGTLGFGPMDWDGDTRLEGVTGCQPANTANVEADINDDGVRSVLTGFDDWNHLVYDFRVLANFANGVSSPVPDEPDPAVIRASRGYIGALLAPGVVVEKTGPPTGRPGDTLTYTIRIGNQGSGPALQAVLTDTLPDGVVQVIDIGALVAGSVTERSSSFTVPLDACPGDFPVTSASVAFSDFVGDPRSASGSAPLQILDVAAPTLNLSVSPTILWPPNHKFQDVTVSISVTDNCDPNPTVALVSITSNEPETGFLGNGDKGPDVQGAAIGTDDRTFSLRSERGTGHGRTGRVYTITYRATDRSGNSTNATATVTVPANQGH